MAEVKWIKFYVDMFDKRKIKKIRRLPKGDKILLFWIMLLATAGKCNAGGMIFITEDVPFEEEDFADEFDFEPKTIRLALDTFVRLDMISITEEGYILVNGWEEHQSTDRLAEMREYNRIAQQKSRAKKKLLKGNNVNDNVNDKSMTSQRCQAIEEEEEEDSEKEYHSIIHSNAREEAKLKFLGGKLGKGVVMLSDEQFNDLLDKLSVEEFDKYVTIVAEKELMGHHYKKKTHYQAILEMVAKDRRIK